MAGRNLFADEPVESKPGINLFADQPPEQHATQSPERLKPLTLKDEPNLAGVNPIAGNIEACLSGGALGFSEEIQSFVAAAVASPFIQDKTFGQIMIDVRTQMREQAEAFREQEGAAALVPEVIGGALTGGGKLLQAKTLIGAAVIGGAEGAIAGAGFADADDFASVETAISSALGLGIGAVAAPVITGAIGVISKALKPLFKKKNIEIFDESGQFTDDAIEELDSLVTSGKATKEEVNDWISSQLEKDGVFTPEQAKRFNLFQSRDITPTRADITQSPDDFGSVQELKKRSGPIADTVAKQDEQLIDLAERGIDSIGPSSQNLVETNSAIFKAIDGRVTELDDIVSQAYTEARKVATGQPQVKLNKLLQVIQNNRGNEASSGGVMSSIIGTLRNKGFFKVNKTLNIDKRTSRLKNDDARKLTVKEAEEIRQDLNSLFDSVSPKGRRLIRDLKNAIDDDVASTVGEDIFADARQAKISFQKAIERPKRNKFDKSRASLLEKIIDNDISEEKILTKIVNARDDDFAKVKQFLTQESGDAGKQAWLDLKAQIVRDALDAATTTAGKRADGGPIFLSSKFTKKLSKLRDSKTFKELFNPDEIKLIDDISEIGRLRVPQQNRLQGAGPTSEAVKDIRNNIIDRIPVVGKGRILLESLSDRGEVTRLLDVTRETVDALQ